MRLSLNQRKVKGKDRIILEFKPSKDKLEQKVLRSIASANFGKKIFIKHQPLIELRFNTKQTHKVSQRLYPSDDSRPEIEEASKLPCLVDQEEYDAAIRTAKAQTLARSLGIKIPIELAKKFYCRCGKVTTIPSEFLSHRKLCTILRTSEEVKRADIVRQRIIEEAKVPDVIRKIKEGFPCRCGHSFPSKRMCTNHQKLCSVIKECTDLFTRCKESVERLKHEGTTSKRKNKKVGVGQRSKVKAKQRKPRRKRTT